MAETPKRYRCAECKTEVNDGDAIDVTVAQQREIYATGYVYVTGRYGPSIEEWDEEDYDVSDEEINVVGCRSCGYQFASLKDFLEEAVPIELKFGIGDRVVVTGRSAMGDQYDGAVGEITDTDRYDLEEGFAYEVDFGDGDSDGWFTEASLTAETDEPVPAKPVFKVGDRVIVNYNAADRKAAGINDGIYLDFEDEPGEIAEMNQDNNDRCSILIEFDNDEIDRWYLPPSSLRYETPPLPPIPNTIAALLSRDLPF